jgi:SAM-dependent methyltransferase
VTAGPGAAGASLGGAPGAVRGPGRARLAGTPTRGKTAANRLRLVDRYLALAHADAWSSARPVVVDVGFGARPWTTLELWARWRGVRPGLRVIGLDLDAGRVAAARARPHPPEVEFRQGGFDVAAAVGPAPVRVIRCLNVLRQYGEDAVPAALALMARALGPGGVLVEGTSTPTGRLAAVDVYRREADGLRHRALVFATNFRAPLDAGEFQTILPKRLIHRARAPGPLAFFEAWRAALLLARPAAPGDTPRHRRLRWGRAAALLRARFGYPVDTRPRILRRGCLALRDALDEAGLR